MARNNSWWRSWEIAIDSDWITTGLMVFLLVFCVLRLAREIHFVLQGRFSGPVHLRVSFWGIWDKTFEAIAAIYFLFFAFKTPNVIPFKFPTAVRFAFALSGTDLAVYTLLSCLRISETVAHGVGICGSVVRQGALVIYVIAIVQWFRSVLYWSFPDSQRIKI